MKRALYSFVLVAGFFVHVAPVVAQPDIRREEVHFKKGTSGASLKGTIKGDQIVDYTLRARAGQAMTVTFKPSNPSANFNVLPPGSPQALFVGSISGSKFEGVLPADGEYTIRVYLMRNAARRNETANYTLEVGIGAAKQSSSASFEKTLALLGIRFHVSAAEGKLRIVPQGLEADNRPIERTIEGTVTSAEVADLNVDQSPEIYVYVRGPDPEARTTLVAYAANKRKSLSEIYLPPLAQDKALSQGYRGGDQFAVVENKLVQRFPIYRESDADGKPGGGTRQLQYKLAPGEAGWRLVLDRKTEY